MNKLYILALGICLCSCVSVGVTPIQYAPAKDENCKLAIYTDEREIRQPYEVLCFIDSMTAGHILADTTVAGAITSARAKACHCGADAMLIHDVRRDSGNVWGHGFAMLKAIRFMPVRQEQSEILENPQPSLDKAYRRSADNPAHPWPDQAASVGEADSAAEVESVMRN